MLKKMNDKKIKKVLFITYGFPPAGGASSMRSLKFVKYLPNYGWLPVVLTTHKRLLQLYGFDYSLLKELPTNVKVFRAPAPNVHEFIELSKHIFERDNEVQYKPKNDELNTESKRRVRFKNEKY